MGATKYIERFRRTNDTVFWTGNRVSRVSDIIVKITMYTLAFYLIVASIVVLGHFAPSIFIGEYMIFFQTLGWLMKDVIFSWLQYVLMVVPWMNLAFTVFRRRVIGAEHIALLNRQNRVGESTVRGSLEDWVVDDSDEMNDFRLERLGL